MKTMKKQWVTPKGASIIFEYEIEKDKKVVPKFLSINGTEISTWNTTRAYKEHKLSCGLVEIYGKKAVVNVEMPEQISLDIYGNFKPLEIKKEEESNSLRCSKCGEFCYGDCSTR